MITFTYTWDSTPASVIVLAENEEKAFEKVARYVLKKYNFDISLRDMIGDVQEEGVLAKVEATL